MRILFLTHSFNGLAQRLHVELRARGHELAVEFDINDRVAIDAVALFEPQLVIAPFLKRAIPEALWSRHVCLVVHPGVVGDRGPSALDWAIHDGETRWGVTVLQATGVMDGGPVWAAREFTLRGASKSSVYRNEVTEAAVDAVLEAVDTFERGGFVPVPPAQWPGARGRARPLMSQDVRRIDWSRDDTRTVLRHIRAGDSAPGVLDAVGGRELHLFDAHPEAKPRAGAPGDLVATRHGAVLRKTIDGAVWITHLRECAVPGDPLPYKQRAADLLGEPALAGVPDEPLPALPWRDDGTWQDIAYEEADAVGVLHFRFHNGAMAADQCRRLRDAFVAASERDTRVIVLAGGPDFWCNGIHLHAIEAAESPADASWDNIVAMDDLCRAVLDADRHLTVAAMQGNAGAGGVFLALAADLVWARSGIVLNPHYKNMGNLYGSEYWTYLLPRRVGPERAQQIVQQRLPIGAPQARAQRLIDDAFGADPASFLRDATARAAAIAADPALDGRLAAKRAARARDEAAMPLERYREQELARMRLNFYGFDPSYHVARYHFVHRLPHAWTPLHLAPHRRRMWAQQHALTSRAAFAQDTSA